MSVSITEAARVALISLLRDDLELVNLLAANPADETQPAILRAYTTAISRSPVYPSLIYRIESNTPNKWFTPPLPGTGKTPVRDIYVQFEAWTNAPDAADIDAIGARLEALLHNESLPLLDGSGVIFKATCVTASPDHYDKDLNAFWGWFRYRFQTDTGEH